MGINIKVKSGKKEVRLKIGPGESILDLLISQEIFISSVCGGGGRCGKCKIQLIEGRLDITDLDKKLLTEEEIKQGVRLACKAYPKEDCSIMVLSSKEDSDFEIIDTFNKEVFKADGNIGKVSFDNDKQYAIAIDIGTTTIAFCLINTIENSIVGTYSRINQQRRLGADVISRIKAAGEGRDKQLQASIKKDLISGIKEIIKGSGINKEEIKEIAISGNTTMVHLLMGYSCQTLGVFPFEPVNIKLIYKSFEEILGSNYLNTNISILPGISTYVGGDIAAGLLACGFDKIEKTSMLIDIGTNGEMAIGNKDKILVCSTAAGPAFEGGNISHGVGSISGAISSLSIENNKVNFNTIKNAPPVGICGTGVIDVTSELIKAKLVDETGLLIEEFNEKGFKLAVDEKGNDILFTQKDIREMQLAKSAIRTGIEILIDKFGIDYKDIDQVFLAGGFGQKINIKNAAEIGLLPVEFISKTSATGNSSLAGTVDYLLDEGSRYRIEKIIAGSVEIELSNDPKFNDYFMDYMFFTNDL